MYKSFGVELNDTDIEVIRRSSLGIEGWALSKFGETEDIDIFPKLPQAPLEGSGLAPPPADGHRAGDSDIFIKAIRDNELITDPSAPLVGGGHAPLVAVGHRAGDENPPGEAAAASKESGEMRNNPDQVVRLSSNVSSQPNQHVVFVPPAAPPAETATVATQITEN